MAETGNLHFRKGDWLAVALVLVLALAILLCFLPDRNGPACAEIYLDGEPLKTVSLNEDQTFTVEGQYCNEITVSDGAIAFTHSDCPSQDCVHSGEIRDAGRILVCLPNKVEIRVVSAEFDVDFVVG